MKGATEARERYTILPSSGPAQPAAPTPLAIVPPHDPDRCQCHVRARTALLGTILVRLGQACVLGAVGLAVTAIV